MLFTFNISGVIIKGHAYAGNPVETGSGGAAVNLKRSKVQRMSQTSEYAVM